MRKLYRAMFLMFVAAAALLLMSGIPALKNAKHGWKDVLGGIGWFGGVLTALALILLAVFVLVRAAIDRMRSA
jgi:hypothetical protein